MDQRGNLRVNIAEFEDIIASIAREHDSIREVLTRLRTINDRLMGSWEGGAPVVFHDTYGNWVQQLENYSGTLTNVQAYLKSVLDNYMALDDAARQAAAGAALPS